MGKIIKIFVVVFLICIVLLGGALLVLMNSGVQRSLVLRFLPEGSQLEAVSIGLGGASLQGLQLPLEGGGALAVGGAEVKMRPLRYFTAGTIHIDTIRARQVDLDMPGRVVAVDDGEAADRAAVEAEVRALLDALRDLEQPLVLGEIAVDGRLFDASLGMIAFEVSGGGFAPGEEGLLRVAVNQDGGTVTPDGFETGPMELVVETRMRQSSSGAIDRLESKVRGTVFLPDGGAVAGLEGLLQLQFEGSERIASVRQEFALDLQTPRWLHPSLEGFEPFSLLGGLQLNPVGATGLELNGLRLHADVGTTRVIAADQLAPLRLGAAQVAEGDLLRLAVRDLATEWLNAFIGNGLRFRGQPLSGEMVVSGSATGGLELSLPALALGPVSVFDEENTVLLRDLRMAGAVLAHWAPDGGVRMRLSGVNIADGNGLLGQLEGNAVGNINDGMFALEAQTAFRLRSLAQQPVLADLLAPLPPQAANVVARFSGSLGPDSFRLEEGRAQVLGEDNGAAFDAHLRQTLEYSLASGAITVETPGATVAEVVLNGVSSNWVAHLMPAGVRVQDEGIFGRLALAEEGGAFRVRTLDPVVLRRLSLNLDGEPILQRVDASAAFNAKASPSEMEIETATVELSSGGQRMLTLGVSGSVLADVFAPQMETLSLRGDLQGELVALSRQPGVAAHLRPLRSGEMTARWSMRGLVKILEADLQLRRLQDAAGRSGPPQDLTLAVNLQPMPNGAQSVKLTGTVGPTGASAQSRFSLDANATVASDPIRVRGDLRSPLLRMADVVALPARLVDAQPVASTTPARPAGAPPRPSGTTPRPVLDAPVPPPWQGFAGEMKVGVDRLVLENGTIVENVGARAVVEADRAELLDITARTGSGVARGEAAARIHPTSGLYTVTTNFDLRDFDPGVFLENPSRFTGNFSGELKLRGLGPSLESALERADAELTIRGTEGLMTLLNLETPAGSAAMLGLGLLGSRTNQPGIAAFTEAIPYFNRVTFDDFNLQLKRSSEGAIDLSSLRLVGPFLALEGSGSIGSGSWAEITRQPMRLALDIGARGPLADHLNTLGLLQPRSRGDGFRMTNSSVTVGGTLSRPDSSSLQDLLWRAALSALTRPSAPSGGGATAPENTQPPAENVQPPSEDARPSELETGLRILEGLLRRP